MAEANSLASDYTLLNNLENNQSGQRWATWFLWKEGVSTAQIYRRLLGVCKEQAASRKTVYNWVHGWKTGRTSTKKRTSSGRKITVTTPNNIARVEQLIMDNPRITFSEMQSATNLARNTLQRIVHEHLDMRKVSVRRFSRILTEVQKKEREDMDIETMQDNNQNSRSSENSATLHQ